MKRMGTFLSTLIMLIGLSVFAHATLVDMQDGTIYDTDTQLSWLKDANYAMTSGYDADGLMTWDQAAAWAGSLNTGNGFAGLTGWRLPSADQSCVNSYNCTNSEMGHLYYTELGNTSGGYPGHVTYTGPFTNLQNYYYWSSITYASNPNYAWDFSFGSGYQGIIGKSNSIYAWAVRLGARSGAQPATVPGAPTGVSAIGGPGVGRATVSFTPPVSDGGSPVASYTATSTPGNITATGSSSPITLTGLAIGTAYTFTVSATNAVGTGPASSPSNSVTSPRPFYGIDGTKPVSGGGYSNPQDGVCVIGLKPDGTMLVDTTITNRRDCLAYTKSADGTIDLRSMTTYAACQYAGSPGNDGYSHNGGYYLCTDSSGNGITTVDLDNTRGMCQSKGGDWSGYWNPSPGYVRCTPYAWLNMNVKPGETIPYRNTINTSGYKGRTLADNMGFCFAPMVMNSASGYNTSTGCPSYHNSSALAPGEWLGGYQTQESFDAGWGWYYIFFTSSNTYNCYSGWGVKGLLLSTASGADGTTPTVQGYSGPVLATAGTWVDLTTITTEGDCWAKGFLWSDWAPISAGSLQSVATTPPSIIVKFDAITPPASGGGNFYDGTGGGGWVCTRCHTDQQTQMYGNYKPGYIKTGHKKAGDNSTTSWYPFFTYAGSDWGLQGVQCNVCHGYTKSTQADLIQVVPAGLADEGIPKSAAGHISNYNTEYGSHVNYLCFHCHGTAGSSTSVNPASSIPVSSGDFALTGKGLAPIGDQFLNSPHALYNGSGSKVDIGNKTKYGSTFVGYICRDTNGIGQGRILSTVYRNGAPGKIGYPDQTTNPACTNIGDGSSTSGARSTANNDAFWVKEGEAVSGGTPADTAQGNCATCHDVHWSLDDTSQQAEPIRRKCTTCHEHPDGETSASEALQVNMTNINHLGGSGTPLDVTDISDACVTCHMPQSSLSGSAMHLWRINTDPAYTTMGTSFANTSPDGTYTNAAWVDLDLACGQCHGGGVSETENPTNGVAPYYTRAQLATVAKGMHSYAAQSYPVTFTTSTSGLTVNVTGTGCGTNSSDLSLIACPSGTTYDWNWGDYATSPNGGATPSHPYASSGTYTIGLVAKDSNGLIIGSKTITVTVTAPDYPPTASATCSWNANTWTMTVTDTSTDTDASPVQTVVVTWGDGQTSVISGGAQAVHTYTTISSYTPTVRATDTALQSSSTVNCTGNAPVTLGLFSITGSVKNAANTLNLSSALVTLRKGSAAGPIAGQTSTNMLGSFTFTNLKPATYYIVVSKSGYTFGAAPSVTVGPNSSGTVIHSTN